MTGWLRWLQMTEFKTSLGLCYWAVRQFIWWILYHFLVLAKKALKEKSRKLHITNELLKSLNQNRHYPICSLYPLLLRAFLVQWTINLYSALEYVHFVVKLAYKIYKEEIFIWRKEIAFYQEVNIRHLMSGILDIDLEKFCRIKNWYF